MGFGIGRFLGFSIGMVVYAIFTSWIFNEGITMKKRIESITKFMFVTNYHYYINRITFCGLALFEK